MPGIQQKIKLMKLFELLKQETDEDHPISRMELCRRLNAMGISSNVRTLSKDIDELTANGYEVISLKCGKEKLFYVPERELSIPEIKIIIDALQAAAFVTEKKTAELVEKVAAIAGAHSAELLKTNTVRFNTRKHTNESVFYTVDGIESAIVRRKKIAFDYFYLNERAERVYVLTSSGQKKRYSIEPVALIFNEDNYYLMAFDKDGHDMIKNYRIDRMDRVEVDEGSTLSEEALAKIAGVAAFTEEAFKMFGGESENITLRFDKQLVGSVFDKFGEDTLMTPAGENTCEAKVRVQIAPTFFGWLAQFGDRMRIVEPQSAAEKYMEHLESILKYGRMHKNKHRSDPKKEQ